MNNSLKQSINADGRIKILDGFRAVAILGVIFYHYFYRWNDPLNPYYGFNFFHYGFRGVPFFFMISGFVIYYTLENTKNFATFWKKRFIRLFPSILIASILTYSFLLIFDQDRIFKDNYFRNLVTSITFLPPNIFNWIFGIKNHFSYINYSYWSLWTEIQFYFLTSTIYFINKVNFKRNFIAICFLIVLVYNSVLFFNLNQIIFLEKLINLFNLLQYLPFFLSGALFYILYKKKSNYGYIIFLIFTYMSINLSLNLSELISYTIMFGLFFCFIYYPKILVIFESRFFVSIGVSSYFLYLIHENIGVAWIRNIAFVFPENYIIPIIIIIVMIVVSIFYTQKVELNINKYLNKHLLKRTNV